MSEPRIHLLYHRLGDLIPPPRNSHLEQGRPYGAQTSLLAYLHIQEELTARQMQVLRAIQGLGGAATMHEVAAQLNVPLNTISGRFSELFTLGAIEKMGRIGPEGYPKRTKYGIVSVICYGNR